MSKKALLMGASALVAVGLGLANSASAATSQLYGGGGSLIAPGLRQILDCYANPTGLVEENSTTSAAKVDPLALSFNYTGTIGHPSGYNCAAAPTGSGPLNPGEQLNYISSGSGAGGATFMSHNTVAYWNDTSGTYPPGVPYPNVTFGESDAAMSQTDVGVYNNGGVDSTFKNVSIKGASCSTCTYPNPKGAYGAVIEIPLLVTPVALAFDPTYGETYDSSGNPLKALQFNLKKHNSDGSGGLVLDMATACAIFNGTITMWSQIPTSLNGGLSLKSTSDTSNAFATLPIELVGRFDSSGTTSIFTRALAAQCPAGGKFVDGSTKLPASAQNTSGTGGEVGTTGFTPQSGLFSLANLSSGVAGYIKFTAPGTSTPNSTYTTGGGKLGYLSPDYVWPNVQFSGANGGYHLDVVDIQRNNSGTLVNLEPNGKNTLAGFNILPPQSDSKGDYVAANPGDRTVPNDWIEPINITLPDGSQNPLAYETNALAYPLVGTTQGFFYTCYNENPAVNTTTGVSGGTPGVAGLATLVKNFLTFYVSDGIVVDAKLGVLAKEGFTPMPPSWKLAIKSTFVKPVTSGSFETDQLNLEVEAGGYAGNSGHHETQCASIVGA